MRFFFTFVFIAYFLCGCSSEQSKIEDRNVLRIGTDATYPPFEIVNTENGRPDGFDIDLIAEVCRVNGWTPEFVVTPFDGIIPGLINKKYDVVISAMTITPERSAVVKFSIPYYLAGQVVAVPLEDTIIKGVEDLNGKRVGVQLGTTGERMAKGMDGLHVFSFDNIGAAFIDMDNGNLDAVLNDFPTTMSYINQQGQAKTAGDILSTEHYGIAMRTDDSELHAKVNSAIEKIKESGKYNEIHMKWFGVLPVRQADESISDKNNEDKTNH